MKQKLIFSALIFSLIICFSFLTLAPKITAKEKEDLPEEYGTYDVPGNPKLKLKVFVHYTKDKLPAKPIRPTPTPTISVTCGVDDNSSTIPGGFTGWSIKNTSQIYKINKNSVPATIGSENFTYIAQNSINAWKTATNLSTFTFTQGSTTISRATRDGQNIMTWGRVSSSNAIAIAYSWYDNTTQELLETDIILNNKLPWAWSGSNNNLCIGSYYDAQNILTHEVGHWFGLNDQYDGIFADHTMYGYGGTNETKKNTLTSGDIFATNLIY